MGEKKTRIEKERQKEENFGKNALSVDREDDDEEFCWRKSRWVI